MTRLEKPSPSGAPALLIQFRSTRDNSGATVKWSIPAQVLDKEQFTVQIKTPGGAVPYVRCVFLDAQGQRICRNNYFGVSAPEWKPIRFAVGRGSGASSIEPAEVAPGQEVATIILQFCGKADREYQVLLSDFRRAEAAAPKPPAPPKESPPRRPPRLRKPAPKPAARPDAKPTIACGDTAVWLDPARGHAFAGASLAGLWLPPDPKGTYPRFTCVNGAGKAVTFGGDDPAVGVAVQREGDDRAAVIYSRDGSSFQLTQVTQFHRLNGPAGRAKAVWGQKS